MHGNIIQALILLAILLQAYVAWLSFKEFVQRDKRRETLNFLLTVRRETEQRRAALDEKIGHNQKINLEKYDEQEILLLIRYFDIFEELAVGANSDVFDLEIIRMVMGNIVVRNWARFESAVEEIRKRQNLPSCYCEMQKLVERLRVSLSVHEAEQRRF